MDELVSGLVLQYLEPRYLLNCRLVSQTWKRLATAELNRSHASVRIKLDKVTVQEYLELLKATATANGRGSEGSALFIVGMQMRAHFRIKDRAAAAPIDPFLEIIKHAHGPVCVAVASIWVRIARNITEEDMLNFLNLTRTTLRELHLRFEEPPAKCASVQLQLQLQLELPALKSLAIDFGNSKCTKVPKIVTAIVLASPSLDHVEAYPLVERCLAVPIPPMVSIFADTETTAIADKLRNLASLKFHALAFGMDEISVLDNFRFIRLRRLEVMAGGRSGSGTALLAPLIAFIGANCPSLQVLEFTDVSQPYWDRPGDGDINQRVLHVRPAVKLPGLTNLKLHAPFYGVPEHMGNQMLQDARHLLESFPVSDNLKSVDLNWDALVTLAALYTREMADADIGARGDGGRVLNGDVFRYSKWSTVLSLNLELTEEPLRRYSSSIPNLLECVSILVRQLFPCLESIVVDLRTKGSYYDVENADKTLGPLLYLLLTLPKTCTTAEINNHYMEWEWSQGQETETGTESPLPLFEYGDTYALALALESLTFRDIRKENMVHVPEKPNMNLDWVLARIPRTVAIHIDSALFLNTSDQKSCHDWAEALRNIDTHKVCIF